MTYMSIVAKEDDDEGLQAMYDTIIRPILASQFTIHSELEAKDGEVQVMLTDYIPSAVITEMVEATGNKVTIGAEYIG